MHPQSAELFESHRRLAAAFDVLLRREKFHQDRDAEKSRLVDEINWQLGRLEDLLYEERDRNDEVLQQKDEVIERLELDLREVNRLRALDAEDAGKWRKFQDLRRPAREDYQAQKDYEIADVQLVLVQDTQVCPACGEQHLVLGRDDVCNCGYCNARFKLDMPRPGDPF